MTWVKHGSRLSPRIVVSHVARMILASTRRGIHIWIVSQMMCRVGSWIIKSCAIDLHGHALLVTRSILQVIQLDGVRLPMKSYILVVNLLCTERFVIAGMIFLLHLGFCGGRLFI